MAFQQNYLGVQYFPNANARCEVYAISVGVSPVLALAARVRGAIFFHNPAADGGPTVWVYQAISPMTGGFQSLAPAAPGTFRIDPAVALEISPCGSGAWYVVSDTAGAALTATEF